MRLLRTILTAVAVLGLTTGVAQAGDSQGNSGSDRTKPFTPDEHTVVLYHFDEGKGDEAHSACGDPKLTLRPLGGTSLWGEREGFGSTARFDQTDSSVLIGPTNDDRIQFRTCEKEWTLEAWVAYTGPGGQQKWQTWTGRNKTPGFTQASIASTDEEGCALEHGYRHGWNFTLHSLQWSFGNKPATVEHGIMPTSRYLGYHRGRDPLCEVSNEPMYGGRNHTWVDRDAVIRDHGWHHIAWQFRYRDQMNYSLVDGKVVSKRTFPDKSAPVHLGLINDAPHCGVPFRVGGWEHSKDPITHFDPDLGNLNGEIDELRISSVMRYPVTDKLEVIQDRIDPLGVNIPFEHTFGVDGAKGEVTWMLNTGKENLPKGLTFSPDGTLKGTPTEINEEPSSIVIRAEDAEGNIAKAHFRFPVVAGEILTESIAPAYHWSQYYAPIETKNLAQPLRWELIEGELPRDVELDANTGLISGAAVYAGDSTFTVEVADKCGTKLQQEFTLRVLPEELRLMPEDEHTVALYDWQGPSGRYFPERVTDDKDLTLTYTNMGADRRYHWPGREGRFPQEPGHGEHAYAQIGPDWGYFPDAKANFKSSPVLDLKTCEKSWTVEAWMRRGGDYRRFGRPKKGKPERFDWGHVCGTYSGGENGTWRIYMTEEESPNGKMVPGVTFRSADHTWEKLDPWNRPEGIVGDVDEIGIDDIEWHHIAWQYDYATDTHELFLDGKLVWKMTNPDGKKLVNDHKHNWQFTIFSPVWMYAKYGGGFNFQGEGNFFGQIGEIRISNKRRY